MLRAGKQEERYAPGQTVILQPGRKRQNRSGSADKNMLEGVMYLCNIPAACRKLPALVMHLALQWLRPIKTMCNTTM